MKHLPATVRYENTVAFERWLAMAESVGLDPYSDYEMLSETKGLFHRLRDERPGIWLEPLEDKVGEWLDLTNYVLRQAIPVPPVTVFVAGDAVPDSIAWWFITDALTFQPDDPSPPRLDRIRYAEEGGTHYFDFSSVPIEEAMDLAAVFAGTFMSGFPEHDLLPWRVQQALKAHTGQRPS
jgi:hypothetical protein